MSNKKPKKTHSNTLAKQRQAEQAVAETVAPTPNASSKYLQTLRLWGRKLGRFGVRSSVPEIALVTSLLLARYLQNSDFSYPSEVILPIILFGVVSTGV